MTCVALDNQIVIDARLQPLLQRLQRGLENVDEIIEGSRTVS